MNEHQWTWARIKEGFGEIKGNKKKLGLERARGYSNRYNFFCNRLVGFEIHGCMPKMSSELLLTPEIQHFLFENVFLSRLGSSRQLLFLEQKFIEKSKFWLFSNPLLILLNSISDSISPPKSKKELISSLDEADEFLDLGYDLIIEFMKPNLLFDQQLTEKKQKTCW